MTNVEGERKLSGSQSSSERMAAEKIIDLSDLARVVAEYHGISPKGQYASIAALFPGIEVIERRPKKAK